MSTEEEGMEDSEDIEELDLDELRESEEDDFSNEEQY